FIVINTAGVAAIAFIFSRYFEYFIPLPHFSAGTERSVLLHIPFIGDIFPLQDFGVKSLTILLILFLTYINYRSVNSINRLKVIYLLVNAAYIYIMNVDAIAASKLVAANALEVSVGSMAAGLISAMIMVSCFGATSVNVMACPRITFAMARDGIFFKWAGRVHPRFQTPGNALWLHAGWSSLLVVSGSFDMLTDMFVFVSWI